MVGSAVECHLMCFTLIIFDVFALVCIVGYKLYVLCELYGLSFAKHHKVFSGPVC